MTKKSFVFIYYNFSKLLFLIWFIYFIYFRWTILIWWRWWISNRGVLYSILYYLFMIKKSFRAFHKQVLTVREHQSNLKCFDLIRSHLIYVIFQFIISNFLFLVFIPFLEILQKLDYLNFLSSQCLYHNRMRSNVTMLMTTTTTTKTKRSICRIGILPSQRLILCWRKTKRCVDTGYRTQYIVSGTFWVGTSRLGALNL